MDTLIRKPFLTERKMLSHRILQLFLQNRDNRELLPVLDGQLLDK